MLFRSVSQSRYCSVTPNRDTGEFLFGFALGTVELNGKKVELKFNFDQSSLSRNLRKQIKAGTVIQFEPTTNTARKFYSGTNVTIVQGGSPGQKVIEFLEAELTSEDVAEKLLAVNAALILDQIAKKGWPIETVKDLTGEELLEKLYPKHYVYGATYFNGTKWYLLCNEWD